jgi:hypothetical protein
MTKDIVAIMTNTGKTHDFKMYKKEVRERILDSIRINGDSGFQGIREYHKNSDTPKKKTKKRPLTKEEKSNNKLLARERILVEHINRKLKIFKILALPYRNRRKRYGLRANLICGIYNLERKS